MKPRAERWHRPPLPAKRPPPGSESELLGWAEALAGHSLGEVAARLGLAIPLTSRSAKGWAGQLLEAALGANAGSNPEPDFTQLGVELKTIPINDRGHPRESTHVCVAPLVISPGLAWESSLVCRKLARVMWIPILWTAQGAPSERRVCSPIMWSPDDRQEGLLRSDWEELIEMIALGRVSEITARHGTALQLRPKAANARSTTLTTNPAGRRVPANPRGFYLRSSFTREILADHFL